MSSVEQTKRRKSRLCCVIRSKKDPLTATAAVASVWLHVESFSPGLNETFFILFLSNPDMGECMSHGAPLAQHGMREISNCCYPPLCGATGTGETRTGFKNVHRGKILAQVTTEKRPNNYWCTELRFTIINKGYIM